MPEFLQQRHRHSCGATVVAHLAGVTLDEAEHIHGKGLTSPAELRFTLRAYGIETDPIRRVTKRPGGLELPGDVVRVRWAGTHRSHWAVYLGGGEYYDPTTGDRVTGFNGGRITSFIPVKGR